MTLGFTLNDGQSCKSGPDAFTKSHIFDATLKITSIETILSNREWEIVQINFFHRKERLVAVGNTDGWVKKIAGRRHNFEIADDEQLIGCEINQNHDDCGGIVWLKMKLK